MAKEQQRSLTVNKKNMEELGISITEVHKMPAYDKPYTSPHYCIAICHSGSIEIEYDFQPAHFNAGDIAIVYPQHTLVAFRSSPDYHATLIAIDANLFSKIAKINLNSKRFVYERLPHFRLTKNQYDDLVSYINSLHRIIHIPLKDIENILACSIYILSQIIDSFHTTNYGESSDKANHLSYRMHNAIVENLYRHRDVQFYANLFHLSPKHFSTVIKQETGHSAGYWIQHIVVLRAKQILGYETDTPIQVIADRFNFPDQASFCRYFKRVAGVSPSEYRSTIQ